MLVTEKLTFNYPNGSSFLFPDIRCDKGEHLLILGESGKGKTTLLHILAGMLKPTGGNINMVDTATNKLSDRQLDKFRGEHIGIVFQTPHFVGSMSVMDNLIMPQFLVGNKINKSKALEVLNRLNLGNKADKLPGELSVGEQQRVAIARAIMNNPEIILADEPTSALDDKNADEVIHLLEEQASLTGASLIIVTHDKRLKDRFSQKVEL